MADFAKLALQAHCQEDATRVSVRDKVPYRIFADNPPQGRQPTWTAAEAKEREKRQSDILSRLFTASLQTARFDEAYSALSRMPASAVRHFSLQTFIQTLVAQNRIPLLLSFPFVNLNSEADEILALQTKKTLNLNTQPQYHKVLYAFRIDRGDYRGAAQVAFERLERLKSDSEVTRNPEDERLVDAYLLLINTLACVGKDEAWVIKEPGLDGRPANGQRRDGAGGTGKRRLISVDDVRREYQEELDRLAALEQGRFAFADADTGGDAMDVL